MPNCMHRRSPLFWIPAFLVSWVLLSPQAALAGMVIQEKTEFVGGGPMAGGKNAAPKSRETTTYIQGKKIRNETGKHVYILDFDTGKMLNLNPAAKTYTEMSLEQLREAQKQAMQWMINLREQMQKNMANMPPESRKAMEEKLAALPEGLGEEKKPAKITIKATGKKDKINGYPCAQYDVYEDGEKVAVYWLTKKVSGDAFDVYQNELNKWLEGMGPLASNRLVEWQHVRDRGFPIKVERVKPVFGKISFNREVLRVEEKSLAPNLFKAPEGYTKTEAPSMPKMGGGGPPAAPPRGMPPSGSGKP